MGNFISNNYRKPKGLIGKYILNKMNTAHQPLAEWVMSLVDWKKDAVVLDVGCGGGANVKRMLTLCPSGKVYGLDYSIASVKKSRRVNKAELGKRCRICLGSVEQIPCRDGRFDRITAFETIYFWPDAEKGMKEIYRTLKSGGQFLLGCNMSDPDNTTYTDQVDGMKVYSGGQLKAMLERAGFAEVTLHEKEGETICLVAVKG